MVRLPKHVKKGGRLRKPALLAKENTKFWKKKILIRKQKVQQAAGLVKRLLYLESSVGNGARE